MARLLSFLALLAALAAAAPWLLPAAKTGARLIAARDDPAAIADLTLASLTAADVSARIEAALASDDPDLADSALSYADARGFPIDPALRARVAETQSGPLAAMRALRSFGAGFVTGTPEDLPGFAGAAAGDLTLWGDVRDAGREGWHYLQGEAVDPLLLGLSAAGLAISAGTYASGGLSAPARMGVSLVKLARRTGRLSAGLLADLSRLGRQSLDVALLRRGATSLDGAAVKAAIRPAGMARLTGLLSEVGTVQAKAGTRATLDGLALAQDGRDVARLARLAEKKGGQTLFILKAAGRGALAISGALLSILWWGTAAAFWLVWLVATLNGAAVALARLTWRRRGKRGQGTAPERGGLPMRGASH